MSTTGSMAFDPQQVSFLALVTSQSPHMVYKQLPSLSTRMALQTMLCHTLQKFSPTIPMTISFLGPPITPTDPTTGHIQLPAYPVLPHPPPITMPNYLPNHSTTIQTPPPTLATSTVWVNQQTALDPYTVLNTSKPSNWLFWSVMPLCRRTGTVDSPGWLPRNLPQSGKD